MRHLSSVQDPIPRRRHKNNTYNKKGKAFQSLGAQAEKERSPYDEEVLGIVKRDLAEERRVREGA